MIFRASVTSSCCGRLNTGSLGGREMLRRVIVVSLLATLYMSSARAQNIAIESTENLYTQCLDHQRVMRNRNNNWPAVVLSNALKCSGTIVGMNTMLNDFSRQGFLSGFKICSHTITPMQAVDIYILWLQKNPRFLNGFASDSYVAAMLEAFSCNKHPWEN